MLCILVLLQHLAEVRLSVTQSFLPICLLRKGEYLI